MTFAGVRAPSSNESAAIEATEFAALMAPFAPFEPAPRLAVAVSGGADSLALTLLADRWSRAQGGSVLGLTVDHRLRADSAGEAAQVKAWLGARDIAHRTLVWSRSAGERSSPEAARAARYALLEAACAEAGILHLLLAHQREDQAETLLLRLGRGSGLVGLAAMAAVTERGFGRVLRPLLGIGRARLAATLGAAAQGWIEDPTNRDQSFARPRLRQLAAALAAEGLTPERLAATAGRLGRSRGAVESMVAALLARAACLDPAGYARLDPGLWAAAPADIALRALAAMVTTIAGSTYPPRLERLERLAAALAAGLTGGRTLGGCRLLPRRGALLVCREPAAVAPPVAAPPGARLRWDGRFGLAMPAAAPPGLQLGALGRTALPPQARVKALPAAVRETLPAFRDVRGVVAVPGLGYQRPDAATWLTPGVLRLRPTRPWTGAGFTVV